LAKSDQQSGVGSKGNDYTFSPVQIADRNSHVVAPPETQVMGVGILITEGRFRHGL
jgi:hypothetical protein